MVDIECKFEFGLEFSVFLIKIICFVIYGKLKYDSEQNFILKLYVIIKIKF